MHIRAVPQPLELPCLPLPLHTIHPPVTCTSEQSLSRVWYLTSQGLTTATLAANARAFTTTKDGAADPAALGLLLMVSEATGKNPRAFGGINLVTALQGSQR